MSRQFNNFSSSINQKADACVKSKPFDNTPEKHVKLLALVVAESVLTNTSI